MNTTWRAFFFPLPRTPCGRGKKKGLNAPRAVKNLALLTLIRREGISVWGKYVTLFVMRLGFKLTAINALVPHAYVACI
jgi:hypothetical protein